jgi:cellulose synthase/poly-beta-1,6-N-acetylglucosamine synthase-like glycosyltransferase
MKVRPTIGEDKALEALLMRDNIYVDYFEDIIVYDEKTRGIKQFNEQRSRWIYTQMHAMVSNLRFLPTALFNRHYDHVDKIVQWMLLPRTVLMGVIALMSVVVPFIYLTPAIKWWVVAAVIVFAFSLATPDYLVDKNWDMDFLRAPLVSLGGLFNIFRAGKNEATDRVGSATRWVAGLGKKKKKRKKK